MAERTGVQVSLYLPAETVDKLKELAARTDVPQSRLVRQALDLLFAKHAEAATKPAAKPRK